MTRQPTSDVPGRTTALERQHVLLLAGVPGVGKTRLARELAPRLDAVVLNRDDIRNAIIPPAFQDYGLAQNELATRVMLDVMELLLRDKRPPIIILDGKPFSRAAEIAEVERRAKDSGACLTVVHCVADPQVVANRLLADLSHDPANITAQRDPEKAARIQAAFEPISMPHIVLETTAAPDVVAERCLMELQDLWSAELP